MECDRLLDVDEDEIQDPNPNPNAKYDHPTRNPETFTTQTKNKQLN
jgi:hypothetical protein